MVTVTNSILPLQMSQWIRYSEPVSIDRIGGAAWYVDGRFAQADLTWLATDHDSGGFGPERYRFGLGGDSGGR